MLGNSFANRTSPFDAKRGRRRPAAAAAVVTVLAVGMAISAAAVPRAKGGGEEGKTLDQLYAAAKAEGGKLVVYAGGDWANQQDATKQAFEKKFPDVKMTMVVDYSKYQDARVDNQLATDTLVPDVVQLQTLQDFPRWKEQGALMEYKPAGFGKVYDAFKDKNGAWVATGVLAFGAAYNKGLVGADVPKSVKDFAEAKWKGKIASAYPNDDDATLYLYSLYVKKFGWDWLAGMAKNTEFLRGSDSAGNQMAAGKKAIGLGGWVTPDAGKDPKAKTVGMLPRTEDPFVAWGQREAILKKARHPAAAKLFLNWQLSKEAQEGGWSVRTDVAPPSGLKQVWEYKNANVDGFPKFMGDRAAAERLRQQMTVYIGEVKGNPTPGYLGTHPGK
ncbi:ABC transporter substrate-binding protein [Streptomyces sp. 4F14]|uniref:ABC transporter substrate-binding protein n=1 Tax=Streptomyces sp. 4F14 TaxID=3394380 RepID=UPI003A8822D5